MIDMNPETVIGDCLETAFSLKAYIQIMDAVGSADFCADSDFRKQFNGFYVIRQKKAAWYDKYYSLFVRQRENPLSFEELLRAMDEFGSLEVSFVSKMIATVNPNKPIWDQYVIGLEDTWEKARTHSKEARIALAVTIYEAIEEWYRQFLETENGKTCIQRFDEALPKYKEIITDVKKMDYLLWSKR